MSEYNRFSENLAKVSVVVSRLDDAINKIDSMYDSVNKQLSSLEVQLKDLQTRNNLLENFIEKRRNDTDSNFQLIRSNLHDMENIISVEKEKLSIITASIKELKFKIEKEYVKKEQFEPLQKGIHKMLWIAASTLAAAIGTIITKYLKMN